MGFESVDIYVKDATPLTNPVPGVTVKILSQDGRTTWTVATSDAQGHVGFLLPSNTTYQLRFFKANYSFTNPQFIQVIDIPSPNPQDLSNAFDATAVGVTPPIPLNARLCTAFGFFQNMSGRPAKNVQIQFITEFNPLLVDGNAVLTERVYVTTDENGYAQVDLFQGGKYNVTVSGTEDYQRCVSVPFLPNVNIGDLLFPVVSSVTFDPPIPATMNVGDPDLVTTPTAYATDGNVLPAHGSMDIQWSSSDNNILGVMPSGGILTIRPLSAGTASVIATRSNQSIIKIPDTGIQGSPAQVVVS
jgi:hypothetical protein